MAKVIKYKYLSCKVNNGTEETPNIKQIFIDKMLPYSGFSLEIARREAYNGKFSIEEVEEVLESVPTAPRNITTGEFFTVGLALYKAISNIPTGEKLFIGQNVIATTIERQLYELKGE